MFDKKNLKPMLLAEIPFDFDKKYLYEIKFDGIRALIYVSKDKINIRTRNNVDITHLFPELDELRKIMRNKKCIFDGEIVLFNDNKPSFSSLQKRMRLKNEVKIKEESRYNPVVFVAFDIIYQDQDLTECKLVDRKMVLNKFKDTKYFVKSVTYDDGEKLFRAVKKMGLEGIVAKEKDSRYYVNKRSDVWIKLKNYQTDTFYIGGYIKNKVGLSLLLGEKNNSKLYYVGKLSVSKSRDIVSEILKEKISKNYFCNYDSIGIFIKPKIKITVNYLDKTKSNMLRHPFL